MNFFFGFSHWKHDFLKPFLHNIDFQSVVFINPLFKKDYFELAMKKGLDKKSAIYIWGKKSFPKVEQYALDNSLDLFRIEDGFIRSVGLGSDLTQPYSLVIDSKGIYFDPNEASDLEDILKTYTYDTDLLNRAKKIRTYLVEKKLSKYNLYENQKIDIPKDKKIILVPGQVEDDASIKYGASGMTNLELLKQVHQKRDDAYIIYKPHPDVLVGNRIGNIEESVVLQYADKIVTEVSLDSVLQICDEVHTMTSLVGFEGLMREKKVFTYGMPFYAGWGLTNDKEMEPRRDRKLSLDELVAATLILYPSYIDPISLKICEIEDFLVVLEKEKNLHTKSFQHRVKKTVRNYISRKSQSILRTVRLKS